jgi:Flp pilus assembly protein TadD/predicted  nucleic acid-binding Zn-ribbon protein
MGWPTGLEPATTRTTIWGSTIELRPPSETIERQVKVCRSFCKNKGLAFSVCFLHSDRPVHGWIAAAHWWIIIARHYPMKRIGLVSVASILILLAAGQAGAGQQDDPSEIFLKAYLTAQQAEKLERENHFKTALPKYRFAGSLIEELRKSHPDWQPAIVEYRGRKISEGILRIQDKAATQNELATAPQNASSPEGGGEVVTSDAAIKEATKKLRSKVDQLQSALDKSRSDLETARKEKELVDARLKEASSKLEKAQSEIEKSKSEIEKSRKSERDVRDQLAHVQDSLGTLQATRDSGAKEQEQLRREVARLKGAATAAEEARVTAEKQRDEANAKFADANKQIAVLTQERDDALAQEKGAKEAEQRVQTLLAENTDLKRKLANAEKDVRELAEKKMPSAQEVAEAKRQLAQLQQQIAETQKQNQYFEARIAELGGQLDEATSQLQVAKLTGTNAEETERLAKENELLRNIIVRERQEEARRYQVKKLVLGELDKLKVQSDALNKQIELLAQPVTKLTSEEMALLRQPVVSTAEQNPGAIKASFLFAKELSADSVKIAEPEAKERSSGVGSTTAGDPGEIKVDVPDDLQNVAHAAKESFDHGKYQDAEKQYQKILTKSPSNLYALCNLGVVYFRMGKLRDAEVTLKKALTVSPGDEFAHVTLGIVYYRQSKFENALAELSQAVEINPNSATAHNYLGITASQKGRQQQAEKEILQAIANNPDYADAHFNLAVILATTRPASKELAKKHYTRATALGIQPDPSLEKLLQ